MVNTPAGRIVANNVVNGTVAGAQTVSGTVASEDEIAGNVAINPRAGGVTEARVQELIEDSLSNFTPARIGEVTLLADAWKGKDNLYSQKVNIEGVTENSQVDLTPSIEELVVFYEKDVTFMTENEGGIVTVYAIGQKPQNDYTIQVTITEVEYE